jgi:hypothetical protein
MSLSGSVPGSDELVIRLQANRLNCGDAQHLLLLSARIPGAHDGVATGVLGDGNRFANIEYRTTTCATTLTLFSV